VDVKHKNFCKVGMMSNACGTLKTLAKLTPILQAQYILDEYIFVEDLSSLEQRLEHLV